MACGCTCIGSAEDAPDSGKLTPIEKRGCTDCLCCIIFLLFWVGMFFIAGYSIATGNVIRLIYGYDSYGNICGMKNSKIENVTQSGMDMTDRGRVFFMDIRQPGPSLEICVSQCPQEMLNTTADIKKFAEDTGSKLCDYDVKVADYESTPRGLDGPCPAIVYGSDVVLNRCVPDDIQELGKDAIAALINFLNSSRLISKIMADLYMARWAILGMCGIALALAFIMVFLIRLVASVIVWLIYIVSILGAIGGTVALWVTYALRKKELDAMEVDVDAVSRNVTTFLVFAILATIFTVILLLVILVMRKRVAFTVELLEEAGKAMAAMPFLLIQPIWTFLIMIVFFVYIVVVFVALSATGTPKLSPDTGHVIYDPPEPVSYMWWYHAIGFIWTAEFILACHQFVIAGSVVEWYFTRDKKTLSSPILNAIGVLICNHLGSMVFGAFIILLVKIPRAILLWIQIRLKGKEGPVVKFILSCLSCCLWCLEKFLKFLNENAYIVIAIEGGGFCSSARKAFIILLSNALRVAAINCVGDFVLFLGKLAVVALTAVCGLAIMGTMPALNFYAVPIFVACIFAYLVASAFMSIYEMAVDTLLLCFCEDVRVNDGSPEKPYFMDPDLMAFVSNSSEALANLKKKKRKGKLQAVPGEDAPDAATPAHVALKEEEDEERSSPPASGEVKEGAEETAPLRDGEEKEGAEETAPLRDGEEKEGADEKNETPKDEQ
ncbi:choline transporter-like protein 1 isoform X2 [Acanthaster planci]|uniref:Choline transporter-like protein n=1 Tax=Acanthaster planci TaxID=133434 RepID=A0A8B7ZAC1_ACAPL|nr:choline transporter-like protein 1 isoform X2 [Acanthaster planci]